MARTSGIFGSSGTGCLGCLGLGSVSTGIFAGPTALGRPLMGLGAVDCSAQYNTCVPLCSGNPDCISTCASQYSDCNATPSTNQDMSAICAAAGQNVSADGKSCVGENALPVQTDEARCGVYGGKWDATAGKCNFGSSGTKPVNNGGNTGGGTVTTGGGTVTTGGGATTTTLPAVQPPAQSGGLMAMLTENYLGIPAWAWIATAAVAGGIAWKMHTDSQSAGFGYGNEGVGY